MYWCELIFSPQLHQTTLVLGHRQSQRVIEMFELMSVLTLTPFLPTSLGQEMVYQSLPIMWLWQQAALHSLQCSGRMLGHILYTATTLLGTAALLLKSLCNVSCFLFMYSSIPCACIKLRSFASCFTLNTVDPHLSGPQLSGILSYPASISVHSV